MSLRSPKGVARSGGFTLIESILVMTILGISAVAIVSMQGNISFGQTGNADMQVGAQLMQECAEQILAVRRQTSYAAVTSTSCSSLGSYGGFSPSVTVTTDTGAACPSGATCETVVIAVSKTGTSLTPVTLELVSY